MIRARAAITMIAHSVTQIANGTRFRCMFGQIKRGEVFLYYTENLPSVPREPAEREGASANPFDQEPGNSGPNPQGHSEHEGRGNNVFHASFLLCAKEAAHWSRCIGAEG